MTLPLTSHGPERFRGGTHCPEHHNGVRTGYPDWCCCCDPCLYVRPSESGALSDLASHSCRCVPQLICAMFTPDIGSIGCAKEIHTAAFASFTSAAVPGTITWGPFFDIVITIRLSEWRFFSPVHGIDQSFAIDHKNVTCFQLPTLSITNVVVGGVTGTITFSEFASSKIPFANRLATPQTEQSYTPVSGICNCDNVAGRLCVNGRRHVGGPIEQVEFVWNSGIGDRWEYLPPFGDPSRNREIIFLRGDISGNCYLELDFEQFGSTTNDWSIPPTSDGDVKKMVAITSCTCEMFVHTETDPGASGEDKRFVTITGGRCSEFDYTCGSCRCVPTYICVFGEIDGAMIQDRATWSTSSGTYGWVLDHNPDVKLVLTKHNHVVPPFSDIRKKPCAVQVTKLSGVFLKPFNQSSIVECGYRFGGEAQSDFDVANQRTNWLWFSSTICGSCSVTTCGECPDRCGSNPDPLYVFLRGIDNGSDDPLDPNFGVQTFCDLTVMVRYFQRWDETTRGTPKCGYIGYSQPITCGSDVYRIKVYMDDFGSHGTVSREYLSGPVFSAYGPTGGNPPHHPVEEFGSNSNEVTFFTGTLTCDPYYKIASSSSGGLWCLWSCAKTIDSVEITVYE